MFLVKSENQQDKYLVKVICLLEILYCNTFSTKYLKFSSNVTFMKSLREKQEDLDCNEYGHINFSNL